MSNFEQRCEIETEKYLGKDKPKETSGCKFRKEYENSYTNEIYWYCTKKNHVYNKYCECEEKNEG